MKICTRCGEEKSLDKFSKQPLLKGGYRNQCVACTNLVRLERRKDPLRKATEAVRESARRRTDSYRIKHAAYEKRRRKENEVVFKAYRKNYYDKYLKRPRVIITQEEKRRRAREACRRHWENNRQMYRTSTLNYLARKRGAEGSHTKEDIFAQLVQQEHSCFWCGTDIAAGWEADHFIPLSRGGTNWPSNIVCSCVFCNRSKGAKMPEEFSGLSRGRSLEQ